MQLYVVHRKARWMSTHTRIMVRFPFRRALVLTSWLLGLLAGYLVLKESTLLLRQVCNGVPVLKPPIIV